jgi:hypothetical protein
MTIKASGISVGTILLVVVLGHVTLFPKVADLDGFYHIGHAFAYAEGGMFQTAMPWATQSVIGDQGADMWWGFHVGLMPFTMIPDVAWSIRVAGLLLTLLLAGCVLWILGRHGVEGAGWWTALFLIAIPNVFFRFLMVRPHMLTLGASLLLLSFLVRGRWRDVFLISTLISWLHLGLFWMAPGVVVAYAMVRGVEYTLGLDRGIASVPAGSAVSAVFLGTVAGWALRPHPIEAGALANIQIVRLFLEKATGQPLLLATEILPLPALELVRSSWLFLGLWAIVLVSTAVYAKNKKLNMPREERTLLLTTLLISSTFLLLALVTARRAMVEWVIFGFLALPIFFTYVVYAYRRRGTRVIIGVLLAAHLGWFGWQHMLNVDLDAFESDTMQGPALFLEEQSSPGEVVFHARWDNFGPLFAHNRKNLYLGGMDPIFQFVHEPRYFWEYFHLSSDVNTDYTCDAFPCARGVATDTYEVLSEHFATRWVVTEPARNPRLTMYLLTDERYRLALETEHEKVFELLGTGLAAAPNILTIVEPVDATPAADTLAPDSTGVR